METVYTRKVLKGKSARRITCAGLVVFGGCGVSIWPGAENADGPRSTLNMSVLDLDEGATYYEANPNHLFELAEPVDITYEARRIRGNISGRGAFHTDGCAVRTGHARRSRRY